MELYAQVLSYAIPIFLLLIAIEWWYGSHINNLTYNTFDTISSLSSGLTNTIKDVLGLTVIILSYEWLYSHLALFTIESSVWLYIIAFIGLDFAGYWSHRFEHTVNVLWNRHVIHHSSEEFNLACALRQPVSTLFALFFFLLIPVAVLGVPPSVIAIVAPLHLFAQFWYHTRLIDRMGWLEHVITTPSHHRVHHAINDAYLDRNYGQVFILWDKWFGTFQEELQEEPPVYGVKIQPRTWNPILINVQHFWRLVQDAISTSSWADRAKLWFMPTGWRPADVEAQYPHDSIKDVHKQAKYSSPTWPLKKAWTWTQFVITNLFAVYFLNTIGSHTFTELLVYGGFLYLTIFSYTSVMDQSLVAIPAEVAKLLLGGAILYTQSDWFGINQYISIGSSVVAVYLLFSAVTTLWILNTQTPSSEDFVLNKTT